MRISVITTKASFESIVSVINELRKLNNRYFILLDKYNRRPGDETLKKELEEVTHDITRLEDSVKKLLMVDAVLYEENNGIYPAVTIELDKRIFWIDVSPTCSIVIDYTDMVREE